ncbi:hypothetical protein MPLA_1590019 [Mesorhizobium sp. ORS 3359]|nr:hypothetical protein MPLA_1590019 [Mesorhizobium sp. ORS 3359]
MARSLPRSQEAGSQNPVHARSTQPGPTLPRADHDHPCDLGLSGAGERAFGRGQHTVHSPVSDPGSSLSAAGGTHNQTERAAGVGRRAGARRREVGQPFEEHADIIIKGSRDTEYGHKLNLTTGRSGMILDLSSGDEYFLIGGADEFLDYEEIVHVFVRRPPEGRAALYQTW